MSAPQRSWRLPGARQALGREWLRAAHYPEAAPHVGVGAAKHIIFAVVMLLFVLTIAQNWAHFSSALMTTAWVRHGGHLDARIF